MNEPLPLVGAHQLGLEGAETEAEIERRTRHMVARALNIRRMVGFVGSGISLAYGLPTWDAFFRSLITFTVNTLGGNLAQYTRQLLTQSLQNTSSGIVSEGADYKLLALGVCEEAFRSSGRLQAWRDHAASRIPKPSTLLPGQADPMRIILERLQIRRFMTINYDSVVEDAFKRVLGCRIVSPALDDDKKAVTESSRWSSATLAADALSLSFDPTRPNDLVQFAAGTPGYECGVFHCHGVAADPRTMIISEHDYQRLYLRDDPAHESYRDALDLALGSNPVMFLGVGMDEADLLRPLRQFASQQHREIRERPLFALLPRPADDVAGIALRKRLLIRFGVKVLFYPNDDGDLTRSLCKALDSLATYWSEWWSGWQRKPMVRKPDFHRPSARVMVHHYSDMPATLTASKDNDSRVADALSIRNGVVVAGLPGTGKGGLGFRLVRQDGEVQKPFTRRFFASTHFTNEVLSIIDGAADFFAGSRRIRGSPLDRLCEALRDDCHLLVIGGLERLLTPVLSTERSQYSRDARVRGFNLRMPSGSPLNRHVQRVLERLNEVVKEGKSKVVLTTSVCPDGVDLSQFETVAVRGITSDALCDREEFKRLKTPALVDGVCRALHGHVYAIAVITSAISTMPVASAISWLDELHTTLTAVDASRRAELAIAKAIRALVAQRPADEASVKAVLHHVALFTTPVGVDAICRSFDSNQVRQDSVSSAIKTLHDAGLILRVPPRDGAAYPRYTAHTVVRTHVLHSLGHLPDVPAEPQRLEQGGFSTESEELQTSTRASQDLIASGVDSVLDAIEKFESTDLNPRRELIRAAFGLIRSQWTATSIGRRSHLQMEDAGNGPRSHYDAYLRRLSRLTNAVRSAQASDLMLDESADTDTSAHVDAMLYADELTWLYGELGMVSYCKGSLYDAYGLLRITEDLCIVAERGRHGRRWCQSEINRGLVDVDLARISRARQHFENARDEACALGDTETEACALGFLGLVRHLGGDVQPALKLYEKAIEMLRDSGNRRALSIFYRHRADLSRRFGDLVSAEMDLRNCLAYAEAGRHPDLVHYARIAQANLAALTGDLNDERGGHELLEPTLEFARVVGIPRLEADALKVQAHIALGRGNTILSRKLALSVMQVAVANGMRLRTTAAMCLIGCVDRIRGNWKGAKSVLMSAMEHAQRQGYYLMVQDAEKELRKIAAWDQRYVGQRRSGPDQRRL